MPNMKDFLTNQLIKHFEEFDSFVKIVKKQENQILKLNSVNLNDYKTSLAYLLRYSQVPINPIISYNKDEINNIINNIERLDFKSYNSQLTKSNVLSLLPAYKHKILSFQNYDIQLNQNIIKLIVANLENNDNIAKQFLYIKLIRFLFEYQKDDFIIDKLKKTYITQDYCGINWFYKMIDCAKFKSTFDIELFGLTLVQLHSEEFNSFEAFVNSRYELPNKVKEKLIKFFVSFLNYDEQTINSAIKRIDEFCLMFETKPKTPHPIPLEKVDNIEKSAKSEKNHIKNTLFEVIKQSEIEKAKNEEELSKFDPIEYFKENIKLKTGFGEDEAKIITVELFRENLFLLKDKQKIIDIINKDIEFIVDIIKKENNFDLYLIKQIKWQLNFPVNK